MIDLHFAPLVTSETTIQTFCTRELPLMLLERFCDYFCSLLLERFMIIFVLWRHLCTNSVLSLILYMIFFLLQCMEIISMFNVTGSKCLLSSTCFKQLKWLLKIECLCFQSYPFGVNGPSYLKVFEYSAPFAIRALETIEIKYNMVQNGLVCFY